MKGRGRHRETIMITKLLIGGVAAAALALPAMAQTAGMSGGADPGAGAGSSMGTSPSTSSSNPSSDSSMSGRQSSDPMGAGGATRSGTMKDSGSTSRGASARTGAASDTSAMSATGLRAGASVRDAAGADVGTITKVDKSGGQTMVTLSSAGKTVTVPASSLTSDGSGVTSSTSKDEVWAPK